MATEIDTCEFCDMTVITHGHHIIPKSKGGIEIASTCETCESFIHKTWTHNELRDIYNSVESIIVSPKFQTFLKWRRKQPITTVFKSSIGKFRDKNKYH